MTDLCRFDDIPDPGSRGPFTVAKGDGAAVSIFVVRKDGEVFGYVNSCPHVGAPLEMDPDRYLDAWGEAIVCSVHGANFDPATGACLAGPCRGKRLTRWPVRVQNSMVTAESPPDGI